MKGTLISFICGGLVFWSLNHKVLENFFKVKRQRIYKSSSDGVDIKNTKVSTIKTSKAKKRNRPLK